VLPISPSVRDSLDDRLLGHFQRSWERQDSARRLLPESWLTDGRPAAQHLNELFLDLLSDVRERIADERDALARQSASIADVRD
jgi:hypothetical protein